MYYGWTTYGGGGGGGWGNSNHVYDSYGDHGGGWGGNENNGSNWNPWTINFGFDDTNSVEARTYILERYVGTALVSRSQLTLYPSQAQALFYEAIRQIAGQSPQGIKIIFFDYIWSQVDQQLKTIENSAEAWNFHRDDWDLS